MSKLIFNGNTHQLSLIGGDGKVVGTWAAYNNVDSHATLKHIHNGTYNIQDKITPHRHHADPNGPYGSYGIIRINVPGHPGIGVHSGRANARHKPGPQHPTMGCIRTTDAAMLAIENYAKTSALTTIDVVLNSAPAAKAASARNRGHHIHGVHAQ